MRAMKALASLRICVDSPKPSLLADGPIVLIEKSDNLCIVSRFYEDYRLDTVSFRNSISLFQIVVKVSTVTEVEG